MEEHHLLPGTAGDDDRVSSDSFTAGKEFRYRRDDGGGFSISDMPRAKAASASGCVGASPSYFETRVPINIEDTLTLWRVPLFVSAVPKYG